MADSRYEALRNARAMRKELTDRANADDAADDDVAEHPGRGLDQQVGEPSRTQEERCAAAETADVLLPCFALSDAGREVTIGVVVATSPSWWP